MGLASTNSFWCKPNSLALMPRALTASPAMAATHISCINFGATLAVTDITPLPPNNIKLMAVASSPLNTAKSCGARNSKSVPRSMPPVASLMPMIFGCWAKRKTVSLLMSQPVRPGTLYKICGMATASAIALKC